jgi:uncharacterized protein
MKVVADTGPLLAAANRRDKAHRLAAALVTELGRELVVLDVVLVEVDQLLRAQVHRRAAARFLQAMADGEHQVVFLSQGLLKRAVEIDTKFSSLDLGLVDASVMAYAERHDMPVFTFDFKDFRAARPKSGYWKLVIDESRYAKETAYEA